jgi:hypothetical protein
MKVLLIQPGHKKETISFDRMIFCEPLGLERVAGALKNHLKFISFNLPLRWRASFAG